MIMAALGIEVGTGKHRRCPICGGKDRFRFDNKEGRGTWFCNQCDPQSGDGFSLVQNFFQCDFIRAAERVSDVLGHVAASPRRIGTQAKTPAPVVRTSIEPPVGIDGQTRFLYTGAAGKPLIYVQRIEHADGSKHFSQWGPTPDGKAWQNNLNHAPKPRPLFQRVEISRCPDLPIVFYEGEKSVLQASRSGLTGVATTTLGGACGHEHTDYGPTKGRHVVIVEDNDEPGRAWAKAVSAHCLKAGALSTKIIALPGVPLKGDIVDWIENGGTPVAFDALLRDAKALLPDGPVITSLVNVLHEEVKWLRHGRIAIGKLTLNVGPPGVGKSYDTLDSASRLSCGKTWPEGTPCPLGSTILLSAEDNLADTIRPRLDVLDADLTKIHAIEAVRAQGAERGFDLSRDLSLLRQAIRQTMAQLVIIDPLTAYLGGIDSHKESEVRGLLAPLAELAATEGVAVVGVMHLNKTQSSSLLNRTVGSIGFVAAARMVFAFGHDPEDEGRCLVVPVKNNLAALPPVLAFRIGPNGLLWENGPVTGVDSDRIFGSGNSESSEDRTTRQDAVSFLADFLADGSAPAEKIVREGKKQGFSASQLRRARQAAKVSVSKAGFSEGWIWRLNSEGATSNGHCHLRNGAVRNTAPDAASAEDATKMTNGILAASPSRSEDDTPSQGNTPRHLHDIFDNNNNIYTKMTKMTPEIDGEEILDLAD
jgi:hypothetical protein